MTTYYKVLCRAGPTELETTSKLVKILRMIPPDGHVVFEHFRDACNHTAVRGVKHACSIGILVRIQPHDRLLGLDSIKFWRTQINESGHRHSQSPDAEDVYLSYSHRSLKIQNYMYAFLSSNAHPNIFRHDKIADNSLEKEDTYVKILSDLSFF